MLLVQTILVNNKDVFSAETNALAEEWIKNRKDGDKTVELQEKLGAALAKENSAAAKEALELGVCININSPQLGKQIPTGRNHIRSHGCMPRGMQMKRILEIGRDEWKKENGYGMRWKVECTFSDLKRILMDILRAKTRWNCVQETLNMVLALNEYKNIRVQYGRE